MISTLCRFYNASGDPIRVRIAHSWAGRFCEREAASIVENGQWTAFLHVHPTGTRKSNVGIEDTDIFFGWRNPWFAIDGTCCTEIREKDHWWSVGSERDMLHLLEENVGSKDQSVQRYKASRCVLWSPVTLSTHMNMIVFCAVCHRARRRPLRCDHRKGLGRWSRTFMNS